MLKKLALGFVIISLVSSCVTNSNVAIPNISSSPGSVKPSNSVPSSSPEPSKSNIVPSNIPSASASPSSPTITATPTPISSSVNQTQTKYNFSTSIDNTYIKISDKILTDSQKEANEISGLLTELNLTTPTIRLEQSIVDPEYKADRLSINWKAYDDIFNSLKNKATEVIIKVDYRNPITNTSIPTISKYIDFLNLFMERYSDYKMSWIFGQKINDPNYITGGINKYVEALKATSDTIKRRNASTKIYMGSLSQSEIFGSRNIKTLDDLLSFINLGADKYIDGFIFEIFSLDNQSIDTETASPYKYTDYNLIKIYSNLITDFLKERGLDSKEKLLITGTYGGDLVEGISQTEDQQANDIFRRIIVAMAGGFSKIILPQIYDEKRSASSTFFKRIGILRDDSDSDKRKLAFWKYKFINARLKDASFVSTILSPLRNVELYLFENKESQLYIVWNTDKNFFGTVDLNLPNNNAATLYISPSDDSKAGVTIPVNTNNKYVFGFQSYNLNPRILEIKK